MLKNEQNVEVRHVALLDLAECLGSEGRGICKPARFRTTKNSYKEQNVASE